MYYIVETDKSVDQAAQDLEVAVSRHKFGVLHIYDMKRTLLSKGFELANECRVFEVCNPQQAVNVLNTDMALNMALPCRISVYQANGKTQIGMIRPTVMLASLSPDPKLKAIAEQVEAATTAIIDEAR